MSLNSSTSNSEPTAPRAGADYRRFLAASALSFALTLALAAALNWLIDPYGSFGAPRIAGFNMQKPAAGSRIRFTKAYYADRSRARTLIAGNSRPEVGLDPQSPCWPASAKPVFNAAVPGASLALQIGNAEHAMATGDVRKVYLGLDLLDFLVNPRSAPTLPKPSPFAGVNLRVGSLGIANPDYSRRRAQDWVKALGSLATLADSIQTLVRQGQADLVTRRNDGFNPARDYITIIRREGQGVLFEQKNQELVGRFGSDSGAVFQGGRQWSRVFETLDRFLHRAGARGVEVILFTNPYHLDYLTTIRESGRWEQFDAWKHTLAQIARDHEVPLWDFHGISPDTTEPPPERGDRGHTLRAFWEPAHYRADYGERMLASMLDADCTTADWPTRPIGVRLDRIEPMRHLQALRGALDAHLQTDVRALARIRCLITRASLAETCSRLGL